MISLTRKADDKLECILCPHFCKLGVGKTGICGVRKNAGEKIELTTYGVLSGYALDPVEKKPLYHFFPGHNILSVGSFGCNMRCDFCQNYHISQKVPDDPVPENLISKIIDDALSAEKNIGIAFTYNEPIISFEYMRDVAVSAKIEGLYTVMVSNGYVNSNPLNDILEFIDAFNIDLKGFTEEYYHKLRGDLATVKRTIELAYAASHVEVTTLIVPGENDSDEEMEELSGWLSGISKDIPLHISRFFPRWQMQDREATPVKQVYHLAEIARKHLNYVHEGNC